MKVRASVKKMCRNCKIIRRNGVVRVICTDPRHKQKPCQKCPGNCANSPRRKHRTQRAFRLVAIAHGSHCQNRCGHSGKKRG